jgi:hypothetical protein
MKTLGVLALLLSTASCATMGAGTAQSNPSSFNVATLGASQPVTPDPSQKTHSGTPLVLPATGGPPVVGIPVGGNLYLPTTGGPPIMATPLTH